MPPAVQALVPPCSNFNSFGVRMGRRRKFLSKLFSFFPRFEKLEIIYKYIVGYIIMAKGRFVNSFLKILSLLFHRSFTDGTQESLLTIFLFPSIKRKKRAPVSEVLFIVLCDPKRRVRPGQPSFSGFFCRGRKEIRLLRSWRAFGFTLKFCQRSCRTVRAGLCPALLPEGRRLPGLIPGQDLGLGGPDAVRG